MNAKTDIYVLIAAAGSGQRFGTELPKQYQDLGSKSILRHSIEKFLPIIEPEHIRVIIDANHIHHYERSIKGLKIGEPIIGSNERKSSVYNGLKALHELKNEDIILIHDAARPLVKPYYIEQLLNALQYSNAATLACSISDTIINSEDNSYPDRNILKTIQTPQAFRYGPIFAAHKKFKNKNDFTDDTSLFAAMGEKIHFVNACKTNFKITTKDDLMMAELLLNKTRVIRTGMGFDVHAFDESDSRNMRLGGIDIPYTRKLKGHSDADVALHTITDALLGAIAAGDIGDHFPPSDDTFKNMDSAVFLKKAAEIIEERGGEIINIDLTIICEEPKIGPHKNIMQERIAQILDIAPSKISIKATTTERLGFTGRQEGIAAQAIANVEIDR